MSSIVTVGDKLLIPASGFGQEWAQKSYPKTWKNMFFTYFVKTIDLEANDPKLAVWFHDHKEGKLYACSMAEAFSWRINSAASHAECFSDQSGSQKKIQEKKGGSSSSSTSNSPPEKKTDKSDDEAKKSPEKKHEDVVDFTLEHGEADYSSAEHESLTYLFRDDEIKQESIPIWDGFTTLDIRKVAQKVN